MKAVDLIKLNLPAKYVGNLLGLSSRCVRKARRGEQVALEKLKDKEVEIDLQSLTTKQTEFEESKAKQDARRLLRAKEAELTKLFEEFYETEDLSTVQHTETCISEYYKLKNAAKRHSITSDTWQQIKKWKDHVTKTKNLSAVQ